jgi:hypothetical protein
MTFVLKNLPGFRPLVLCCLSQRPDFRGRSVRGEFVVHKVVMKQIILKVFLFFSANILPQVHSTHFSLYAAFYQEDRKTSSRKFQVKQCSCGNVDVQKEIYIQIWWSFEKLSISLLKYLHDKQKWQIKQIGVARGITPISVAIKQEHLGLLRYSGIEISKLVPTFRSKLLPPSTG